MIDTPHNVLRKVASAKVKMMMSPEIRKKSSLPIKHSHHNDRPWYAALILPSVQQTFHTLNTVDGSPCNMSPVLVWKAQCICLDELPNKAKQ